MVFILVKRLSLRKPIREEIVRHERDTVVHFSPLSTRTIFVVMTTVIQSHARYFVVWNLYFLLITISLLFVAFKKKKIKTGENQTAEYGKSWKYTAFVTVSWQMRYCTLESLFFRQRLWEQQVAQHESILVSITSVKMENSGTAAHEYPWNGQELQTYETLCSAQLV